MGRCRPKRLHDSPVSELRVFGGSFLDTAVRQKMKTEKKTVHPRSTFIPHTSTFILPPSPSKRGGIRVRLGW